MNKDEFLRKLEALLSGISQEERTEALAFYRSYFEDAGEANEAKILEELESPQKVADSIIKDLGVQPGEACSSGAQGASAGAEWNPAVQSAPEGATTGAEWNPAVRGAAQNASKGVPQEQRRMQRILRRRRMECRDGRSFFWSSLRRCGW